MKTFEEFLQSKFMKNYHGDKEHCEDAFEMWIEKLDLSEVMDYADDYGSYKYMQAMEKCGPDIK